MINNLLNRRYKGRTTNIRAARTESPRIGITFPLVVLFNVQRESLMRFLIHRHTQGLCNTSFKILNRVPGFQCYRKENSVNAYARAVSRMFMIHDNALTYGILEYVAACRFLRIKLPIFMHL